MLLDQSKLFDKAEKNLTIRECHKAGIQGGVLYQLYQIINNREIRVKVNNAYSKPRKMSNGSPQGLALSLPMTSIYTNGLKEYLDSVEKTNEDDENVETDHKYFIDDLTLLIYTNRSRGGIAAAQKILDKVYLYFEEKNLCLNYDKTKIMVVRPKQD